MPAPLCMPPTPSPLPPPSAPPPARRLPAQPAGPAHVGQLRGGGGVLPVAHSLPAGGGGGGWVGWGGGRVLPQRGHWRGAVRRVKGDARCWGRWRRCRRLLLHGPAVAARQRPANALVATAWWPALSAHRCPAAPPPATPATPAHPLPRCPPPHPACVLACSRFSGCSRRTRHGRCSRRWRGRWTQHTGGPHGGLGGGSVRPADGHGPANVSQRQRARSFPTCAFCAGIPATQMHCQPQPSASDPLLAASLPLFISLWSGSLLTGRSKPPTASAPSSPTGATAGGGAPAVPGVGQRAAPPVLPRTPACTPSLDGAATHRLLPSPCPPHLHLLQRRHGCAAPAADLCARAVRVGWVLPAGGGGGGGGRARAYVAALKGAQP